MSRLQGFLLTVFTYGFKFLAPAWAVARDESKRLAEVWAKVGAKYLPIGWLRWIPAMKEGGQSVCIECDALAVTVEILRPRLKVPAYAEADDQQPDRPRWCVRCLSSTMRRSSRGLMGKRNDGKLVFSIGASRSEGKAALLRLLMKSTGPARIVYHPASLADFDFFCR